MLGVTAENSCKKVQDDDGHNCSFPYEIVRNTFVRDSQSLCGSMGPSGRNPM